MLATLRQAGIRVVANIKPWLLTAHPEYAKMTKKRAFVWDDQVPTLLMVSRINLVPHACGVLEQALRQEERI